MTALTLAANHDVAGTWALVALICLICAACIVANLRGGQALPVPAQRIEGYGPCDAHRWAHIPDPSGYYVGHTCMHCEAHWDLDYCAHQPPRPGCECAR